MAESDALNLRIPLMSPLARGFCAIGALVLTALAVWFLVGAVSGGSGARWVLAVIPGVPFLLMAAVLAYDVIRFGRLSLLLDHQGIWLEGKRRQRLPWDEVVGYQLAADRQAPMIRILGRNGKELCVPQGTWNDFGSERATIHRILDRHVGPDGERPPLALPQSELDRRFQIHDGVLPRVEMEPNVRYRYTQSAGLRKEVRERLPLALGPLVAMIVLMGVVWAPGNSKPSDLLWTMLLGGVFLVSLWRLAQDWSLLRRLEDRFVRRGDDMYVIRNGHEFRLPPGRKDRSQSLAAQPTSVHGRGPFPYRMAPQLLEPDV